MMKGLNNYDRTFHQFVTFCCHIQGFSRVMSHHEAMLLVTLGVNCNLASSNWSSALLANTNNDIVCHQYTYYIYIYIYIYISLTQLSQYSHTSLTHTHHSLITHISLIYHSPTHTNTLPLPVRTLTPTTPTPTYLLVYGLVLVQTEGLVVGDVRALQNEPTLLPILAAKHGRLTSSLLKQEPLHQAGGVSGSGG
jgi:hypothetical protein